MAVYFITLHAYRSWRPDHPRGYVRRDEGILAPDPERAAQYDANATQEPVEFTLEMQNVMIAGTFDLCGRRNWRLHAFGGELNHSHFLLSWRNFTPWLDVRSKLKTLLSLFLGRLAGMQNRKWFVEGGSRKRVTTQKHFDYLIQTYIPKHSQQKWYEGDPLPFIPDGILNPGKQTPSQPGAEAPRNIHLS